MPRPQFVSFSKTRRRLYAAEWLRFGSPPSMSELAVALHSENKDGVTRLRSTWKGRHDASPWRMVCPTCGARTRGLPGARMAYLGLSPVGGRPALWFAVSCGQGCPPFLSRMDADAYATSGARCPVCEHLSARRTSGATSRLWRCGNCGWAGARATAPPDLRLPPWWPTAWTADSVAGEPDQLPLPSTPV